MLVYSFSYLNPKKHLRIAPRHGAGEVLNTTFPIAGRGEKYCQLRRRQTTTDLSSTAKTSSTELKMRQGAGSLSLLSSQHTYLPSHHTLWIVWKKVWKRFRANVTLGRLVQSWLDIILPTNKLFPAVMSNCKM